ncbi:MAG: rubrerythrin family protein [Rikenellaceae bacterium]|nr:rubrerythrin family protein [Rikenellaceae bacterium]
MKPRNIVIMIFCLFAGAAMIVTLHIRSKMSDNTLESQWQTTTADLHSAGTAAHARSIQYDTYARQAAIEQLPSHEQLFLALAHSERIHEQMCAKAAHLFGSKTTPGTETSTLTTSTPENLARSLASARTHHRLSKGNATTRALNNGNRYVARIFIWIDGSNRRHIELLEKAYNRTTGTPENGGYLVCPKCGNTYHTSSYDAYCPFCHTHHSDFKRF